MEEEKTKKTTKNTTKSSSVKKSTNTTKTKQETVKKKTTKKTATSSTKKNSKTTSKKTVTKKDEPKSVKKVATNKATKKASTKTTYKKTTKKAATKKAVEEPIKKSTTKKSTTKKVDSKNLELANKTSTKRTTKTKKETEEIELPKKKTTTKRIVTKEKELSTEIELPKKKAISDLPKEIEEDLIITRKLDINVDDYTFNLEGLVEKVKEELKKDETTSEEDALKEDPFKEEKLFSEIFEDNKNVFKRLFKKKTPKKEKESKEKIVKAKKEKEPKDKPETRVSKLKKESRKQLLINLLIIVSFLLIIIGFISTISILFSSLPSSAPIHFNASEEDNKMDDEKQQEVEEKRLLEEYNKCLIDKTLVVESEDLNNKITEVDNYIKSKYSASVLYEDLTYGYTYSYNRTTVYYAASTIKSLDALYIYTKAAEGKIDLDTTIKFTGAYPSSKKMKRGTSIPIRDVVKYAVEVSDNAAHFMLIDYIGKSKLQEFGKSLGATKTLVGGDNFGNINVDDAIIYMKAINDFINTNEELGHELQSYFLAAEQNDLEMPDLNIKAAHKYGEYSPNYHDIGIVYDEHPYVIAILTKEKNHKDFEDRIKDINKHIYDLHQTYYIARESTCKLKIYGE